MEKTLDTLYRIVKEPKLWILISVAFFLIYFLASKFKLPEHINIIGILKEYKAIRLCAYSWTSINDSNGDKSGKAYRREYC